MSTSGRPVRELDVGQVVRRHVMPRFGRRGWTPRELLDRAHVDAQ